MDEAVTKVRELLHEAGETHHMVYRIVDGVDDDWASWYSDWLVNHSELADIVGAAPVRSELTWLLVQLDKDYVAQVPSQPWEAWYAERVVARFGDAR
jgi:hypothetical protein